MSSVAFAGISGELSSNLKSNRLDGNKDQSFVKNDFSAVNELRISQNSKLSENSNFSLDLSGRNSNDINIEPDEWALTNIAASLMSDRFYLSLGNVAPDFSDSIFSQSLIGMNFGLTAGPGNGLSIKAAGGSTAQGWRELSQATVSDYRQYAGGISITQEIAGNSDAGISIVHVYDDNGSFDDASLIARKNTAVNLNFNLNPARRFNITGEISRSLQNYDLDRSSISTEDNYYNAQVKYGFSRARMSLRYMRSGPEYDPLCGSASRDSEQWKAAWSQALGKNISQTVSYNLRSNNLNDKLAVTTIVRTPQIGWEIKLSRPAQVSVSLRREERDSSVDQVNDSCSGGLRYSKAFMDSALNLEYRVSDTSGEKGRQYYVSGANLTFKLRGSEKPVTAGMNFSRTDDMYRPGSRISITASWGASLNWTFFSGLACSASYSLSTFDSAIQGSRNSEQKDIHTSLSYALPAPEWMSAQAVLDYSKKDLEYSSVTEDNYSDNIYSAKFSLKF